MITITKDGLKTFFQGALGAMTFGAYHQYTTNKIIELNNEMQNNKFKEFEERNNRLEERNNRLEERNNRLEKNILELKQKLRWF